MSQVLEYAPPLQALVVEEVAEAQLGGFAAAGSLWYRFWRGRCG